MKDLYSFLLQGREHDSKRFWDIFVVMNVINGALFGLAFSNLTVDILKILAAVLGIGLCVLWAGIERRMDAWVKWWESILNDCEPHYLKELQNGLSERDEFLQKLEVFHNREGKIVKGFSTRVVGILVPVVFLVGWLFLLVYSQFLIIRQFLCP
ncbi:MAG: hypothetical protein ABIJ25_10465 [Pseudomonadota bacterium]